MRLMKFEITKFTLVGACSFVLTFLIFVGFLNVLHAHYLVALGAAWMGGVLFTYTVNVLWVFNRQGSRHSLGSFLRYAFSSGVSVTLNALALTLVVEQGQLDPFIAQFLLLPFVVAFNFFAAKYWSLRLRRSRDVDSRQRR